MRIIGGSCRGRKLLTPGNLEIRPTSDRVKEALFNILISRFGNFSGLRVLDIFAGTGNLGIEALSRGASEAVFVDEGREAAALIVKNLELCGLTDRARVVQKQALAVLKGLAGSGSTFDLIFLDPPYRQGLSGEVLEFLGGSTLGPGSVVVAETDAREELDQTFSRLRASDRRIYGDTAITIFDICD